jgi:hypothetical protein
VAAATAHWRRVVVRGRRGAVVVDAAGVRGVAAAPAERLSLGGAGAGSRADPGRAGVGAPLLVLQPG